ncbi:MAG TPA: hypothetical protein V6C71_07870 [Coleofasciculaceae cyanobacterium]|jgi:alpha-D-ribose 1-methylphosphonate 5-phosphate C-P lyase
MLNLLLTGADIPTLACQVRRVSSVTVMSPSPTPKVDMPIPGLKYADALFSY